MPILPECNEELQNQNKITFSCPAIYNKKVKIHDWQMYTLAEPRDNEDIFPPKGNLQKSTYRRLGLENPETGTSETQAMLAQIELKDHYKQIYPHRTLYNIRSIVAQSRDDEEKDPTVTDLLTDPEALECIDYKTTTELDYRLPYPIKSRPPPPPPPPEPWLLNRRTVSYCPEELGNRNGIYTFLDDNMETHEKIAILKSQRYKVCMFILKLDLSESYYMKEFYVTAALKRNK